MRNTLLCLLTTLLMMPLPAQTNPEGPTDEKAQKTYKEAFEFLKNHRIDAALDHFKKADKQNGGHCLGCQKNMIAFALELQEWKTAEAAAEEMVAEAQGDRNVALAHYQFGIVL